MVQSLELLVDDASDRRVRDLWRRLSRAGLASQGDHTGTSNAPHVTLGAWPWLPDGLDGPLAAAVRVPFPLGVTGPHVFAPRGTRGRARRSVLVVLVDVDAALAAVQEAALAVVAGAGGPAPLGDHFAPGSWTPHVTLAHLPTEDVDTALDVLDDGVDLGGGTSAQALRRWDSDRRVAWVLPDAGDG